MSTLRFSREDYALHTRRLVSFANEEGETETVEVHRDVLRLAAALLSEAASRAPTHRELAGVRCARCGHGTNGHREGVTDYCTTCGGVL